jgi:hypothetical protein
MAEMWRPKCDPPIHLLFGYLHRRNCETWASSAGWRLPLAWQTQGEAKLGEPDLSARTYRLLPDNWLQIGSRSANIGADASHAIHLQRLTDALQVKFSALRGIEVAHLGAVPPHRPEPARPVLPAPRCQARAGDARLNGAMSLMSLIALGLVMIFAAGLIRGFTGFGLSIAAVPLLSLILPPSQAIPIVLLLQLLVSLSGLRASLQICNWPAIRTLAIGAVIATPLGAGSALGGWMFRTSPEAHYRFVALCLLVVAAGLAGMRALETL